MSFRKRGDGSEGVGDHQFQRREIQRDVWFYRQVRPIGLWGPVARLCPEVRPERELAPALVGWVGGLAATYGLMLGLGFFFLGRSGAAAVCALLAVAGAAGCAWALARLAPRTDPGT